MVLPHLGYCNSVWASTYKTAWSKLFILQKRALRVCSFSVKKTPSMTLFTKLNKLTIYDVNKYKTAKFVYLFYKGLLPYSFKSIFILINKIHQYRTRNEGNFFCMVIRLTFANFQLALLDLICGNQYLMKLKSHFHCLIFESRFKKFLIDSYIP